MPQVQVPQQVANFAVSVTPQKATFGSLRGRQVERRQGAQPRVQQRPLPKAHAGVSLLSLKYAATKYLPGFHHISCRSGARRYAVHLHNLLRTAHNIGSGTTTAANALEEVVAAFDGMEKGQERVFKHRDARQSAGFVDERNQFEQLAYAMLEHQFKLAEMTDEEAKNVFRGMNALIADMAEENPIRANLIHMRELLYRTRVQQQIAAKQTPIARRLAESFGYSDPKVSRDALERARTDVKAILTEFGYDLGRNPDEIARLQNGLLKEVLHLQLLGEVRPDREPGIAAQLRQERRSCMTAEERKHLHQGACHRCGEMISNQMISLVAHLRQITLDAAWPLPGESAAGSSAAQDAELATIQERRKQLAKSLSLDVVTENLEHVLQSALHENSSLPDGFFQEGAGRILTLGVQEFCRTYQIDNQEAVLTRVSERLANRGVAAVKLAFADVRDRYRAELDRAALEPDREQELTRQLVQTNAPRTALWTVATRQLLSALPTETLEQLRDSRPPIPFADPLRSPQRTQDLLQCLIEEAIRRRPNDMQHTVTLATQTLQNIAAAMTSKKSPTPDTLAGDRNVKEFLQHLTRCVHDVADTARTLRIEEADQDNESSVWNAIEQFSDQVKATKFPIHWLLQLEPEKIKQLKADLTELGIDVIGMPPCPTKKAEFRRMWIDWGILPGMSHIAAQVDLRGKGGDQERHERNLKMIRAFGQLHQSVKAAQALWQHFGPGTLAAPDEVAMAPELFGNTIQQAVTEIARADGEQRLKTIVPDSEARRQLRLFLKTRERNAAQKLIAQQWDLLARCQQDLADKASANYATLAGRLREESETLQAVRKAFFGKVPTTKPDRLERLGLGQNSRATIARAYGLREVEHEGRQIVYVVEGMVSDQALAWLRPSIPEVFQCDSLTSDGSLAAQFTIDAPRQTFFFEHSAGETQVFEPTASSETRERFAAFSRFAGSQTHLQLGLSCACTQTVLNAIAAMTMQNKTMYADNGVAYVVQGLATTFRLARNMAGDVVVRCEGINDYDDGNTPFLLHLGSAFGNEQEKPTGKIKMSLELTFRDQGRQIEISQPLTIDEMTVGIAKASPPAGEAAGARRGPRLLVRPPQDEAAGSGAATSAAARPRSDSQGSSSSEEPVPIEKGFKVFSTQSLDPDRSPSVGDPPVQDTLSSASVDGSSSPESEKDQPPAPPSQSVSPLPEEGQQ